MIRVPKLNTSIGSWSDFSNGSGLYVSWTLGADPMFTFNTSNQWFVTGTQAGLSLTGSTDFQSVLNRTFSVAAPMVYVGNDEVPFATMMRDPVSELILCQRYYEKSYDEGIAPGTAQANGATSVVVSTAWYTMHHVIPFRVTKRSPPSVTMYGHHYANITNAYSGYNTGGGIIGDFSAVASQISQNNFHHGSNNGTLNATAGNYYKFQWVADSEIS